MKTQQSKKTTANSFINRFLTGMVIALAATLTAFEWTSVSTSAKIIEREFVSQDDELMPPITYRIEKLEKPKPKASTDQLTVVEELAQVIPEETPEMVPLPEAKPEILVIDPNAYGMGEEIIEEDIIYEQVQVFAHYEACKDLMGDASKNCSQTDLVNRINEAFRVSPELKDIGRSQAVLMSMVIDREGNIGEIKAVQSTSLAMEKAAKKAIEALPQMNPAQQQGRAVSLRVQVPIRLTFNR